MKNVRYFGEDTRSKVVKSKMNKTRLKIIPTLIVDYDDKR